MPVIYHSGGSETSHDIGEKYKQLVAEYYREKGFIIERQSNHHATTEDLAAVTVSDDFEMSSGGKEIPGQEYFREVRVEAKAGELSRLNSTFIDELLRVFLDYKKEDEMNRWFEYHIFTPHLQASDKWDDIFDRQQYDDDAVKSYYEETRERNELNSEEEELFSEYGFEDFKKFLTDVTVHEADKRRLRNMIQDEKEIDRSKWEFYTREYEPFRKRESLIPNFLKITNLPDHIWVADCHVNHYTDIFEENPRHTPVYYENGQLYSLLPEAEMEPSLTQLIDTDSLTRHDFLKWEQGAPLSTIKNLLNRAIKRRAVMNYDACKIVRHDYDNILLFQHTDIGTVDETESDQTRSSQVTLNDIGKLGTSDESLTSTPDTEQESDDPASKRVGRWKVTMEWGTSIAHRYCLPQVKRYSDEYYVIVETGYVFSENGFGDVIIEGDRASEMHSRLQSNQYHNPGNEKAQFRQWRAYLDLEQPDNQTQRTGEQDPQSMAFAPIEGLSLNERPPKNPTEKESIKTRLEPYQ